MDGTELDELRLVVAETGAVVSHGTAAQLWGLRLRQPPLTVTVTVARSRSKVRRDGYDFRRAQLGAREIRRVQGVAVTSPARTVVDLARCSTLAAGVVVADSALDRRLVSPAELVAAAGAAAGPGAATVRRVSVLADGRSQSVPESLLRLVLRSRGEVGRVIPQFRLPGCGHPYDLGLPDLRIVVEFQSWEHHGERTVWRRDARWGNEACARGWGYLQLTWEDLLAGGDHVSSLVLAHTHNRGW